MARRRLNDAEKDARRAPIASASSTPPGSC